MDDGVGTERSQFFDDRALAEAVELQPGSPSTSSTRRTSRMPSSWRHEQTERAASETRYQRLFEQASKELWNLSASGEILDANPAALRMFGYDSLREVRESDLSAVSFFCRRHFRQQFEARMANRHEVRLLECRMRRRDGGASGRPLTAQRLTEHDGGDRRLRCRIVDVTDRVNAQQALAASEARFRSLIEHVPTPIVVISPDGSSSM